MLEDVRIKRVFYLSLSVLLHPETAFLTGSPDEKEKLRKRYNSLVKTKMLILFKAEHFDVKTILLKLLCIT